MGYRNMNEDSLQRGVTELAARILDEKRQEFQNGYEAGRRAAFDELLDRIGLLLEAREDFTCLSFWADMNTLYDDYRTRYPATPAAAESEETK